MNAEELFEINIKKLTEKELFFCSETIEYVQSGHIEQPCIGDNKSETIDVQHIFLLANEMDIEKILKVEEENDVYSGMLHKKHEGIPMLPLYLYYDRQQFECMISSYDMTKLCEIYRIVILVGRDALINFFCEMDTLMPNMILGDRDFAITNIIDNIYKNKTQIIGDVLAELRQYYNDNAEAIRRRVESKDESICVVKNYFEPQKFRYFYQQLKQSLEKEGHIVNVCTERGPVFRTPDVISIYKYKPDVVFQINKARNGRNYLGESLNLEYFEQLFFVNWIQDIHPAVLDETYAEELQQNDILFSLFDENVMEKYHYPMSKVILGAIMPADSVNYCIHNISDEEHSKYDCDIAFIGTIMTDEGVVNYIYKSLSPFFTEEQIGIIADSLFEMLENMYNSVTGKYNITSEELNKYIYNLQEKMQLNQKEKLNIYRVFSVVRYNSLRKLILQQLAKRNRYKIILYGENDVTMEGVDFGGFIDNKEELSKAIQCANMVIQINPDASMNQRVIEGLLSHTMALVFKMDDASDMSNIENYLGEGEGILFFRTKQELFDDCDMMLENKELRESIIEKGYQKAIQTLTTDAIFGSFINELSKKVQ